MPEDLKHEVGPLSRQRPGAGQKLRQRMEQWSKMTKADVLANRHMKQHRESPFALGLTTCR